MSDSTELEKSGKVTKKTNWARVDPKLERSGEKIILPNTPTEMPIPEAVKQLERIHAAENKVFDVSETVDAHFFDGLVAFNRAMVHKYGFSLSENKRTWFGDIKPRYLHVKCGPGVTDVIQVAYGMFSIPGIDEMIETGYTVHKGIPKLQIQGSVKAKEKTIIMELVALTTEFARQQSIYKGQSVILPRGQESGDVDFDDPLEFFDPHIGNEVPIFNAETQALIDVNIKAPIQFADRCRKERIPLKSCYLLEGPYGTGKSLTARDVARTANDNDWTFLSVSDVRSLNFALKFARMYQPCVIFAEDIDRLAGDRNDGANDLINEISGILGNKDEIIIVLTTNYAEKIEKAMLRPGRLDGVISLRPPEPDTVKKLIQHYAGDLIKDDENLDKIADKLKGNIPSTIREVVERSKKGMILRGAETLNEADLVVTADGMAYHLKLLDDATEGQKEYPPLEEGMRAIVGDVINARVQPIVDKELKKRFGS